MVATKNLSITQVNSNPDKKLPLVECYGPVVQGEGALIGRPTIFVRLGGCDYRCSWCDSLYAVIPEEVHKNAERLTPEEIVERVRAVSNGVKHVTLSGGNPVIHDCSNLVHRLKGSAFELAVETQGTIWRPWLNQCHVITVSPKPPSSGMVTNYAQLNNFIYQTSSHLVLKIVVFDDDDFAYAKSCHIRYPTRTMYLQPGNAVGADTAKELLEKLGWLSETALRDRAMQDCIVLPQLHVLLYSNQRGR